MVYERVRLMSDVLSLHSVKYALLWLAFSGPSHGMCLHGQDELIRKRVKGLDGWSPKSPIH